MALAVAKSGIHADSRAISYEVYTYEAGNEAEAEHPRWHRLEVVSDRKTAFDDARELHDTGFYHKVEIKQIAYDPKRCRCTGKTCKTYRKHAWKNSDLVLGAVFSVFSCTVFAVFVAFMM